MPAVAADVVCFRFGARAYFTKIAVQQTPSNSAVPRLARARAEGVFALAALVCPVLQPEPLSTRFPA
jgi:hypothetical protein